MNYFKVFLLGIVSTISLNIKSQEIGPPSLSVGASEVLYEKGKLDAELIAAIISTKQDELKKELANRLILKRLENGSFTLWYYSKQTVDLLFNEKDKSIIKKEMLRNSVELMTVVAVTEFYLRHENKNSSTEIPIVKCFLNNPSIKRNLKAILEENNLRPEKSEYKNNKDKIMETLQNFDFTTFSIKEIKKFNYTRFNSKLANTSASLKEGRQNMSLNLFPRSKEIIEEVRQSIEKQERNAYLQKPSIIFKYNQIGSVILEDTSLLRYKIRKELELGNIILDMVFDVCSKNSYFQSIGLFQRKIDLPERQFLDNYQLFTTFDGSIKFSSDQKKDNAYAQNRKELDPSLTEAKRKIDLYLKFIGQFSYAIAKTGLGESKSYELLDNVIISKLDETLKEQTSDNLINRQFEITKKVNQELKIILSTLQLHQESIKSFIETISANDICDNCDNSFINDLIKLYSSNSLLDEANSFNTRYFIGEVLYPKLIKAQGNPQMKVLLTKYNAFEETLDRYLEWQLLKQVSSIVGNKNEYERLIESIKNYAVRVIEVVNALDDAQSYEKAGKFLADIGSLSQTPMAQKISNSLLNINDKYLTVNKDSNLVQIDVESAFSDIYSKYVDRIGKRISPYFSIGINYNFVNKINPNDTTYEMDVNGSFILDSFGNRIVDTVITDTRENTGFISEKIGIKVKILDWAKQNMYGSNNTTSIRSYHQQLRKTQKPFVNDLYVLAYASGLLYQIEALKTSSEFNSPIIGMGIGMSFFNNLDLNVNYAYPTNAEVFNDGFWNVSFDIKITEYLSELSKKRRLKSLEKDEE
ncbi:MAG: hypothetical protein RIC06_17260 [Cyclobacteriaceae bacterium]